MSCTFYRYNGGIFSGDYWCDKKNTSVNSDDYYRYCRDYNYEECPIYKHQESSGCFITTVVCNIVGKNDDDIILQSLRNFRDNILQKNEQYYNILKEYDSIGPIIAECLANDESQKKVAITTYQNSIIPIYYLIYHKKYEQAIERYQLMTQILINNYGLNSLYNEIKNNNYNYLDFIPETSGHGKRRTKSIEITQNV